MAGPGRPGRGIAQTLTGVALAALYIIYAAFLIYMLVALPLIGLVTGVLHLPVRGGWTFHGPMARVISAALLIVAGWVAWLSVRKDARGLFFRLFRR